MKALTIIQPWATLLAAGKKRIETRSWKTNYRGEILIHAGGMKYNYFLDVCQSRKELIPYFRDAGIGSDADLQALPFKAIVGKAQRPPSPMRTVPAQSFQKHIPPDAVS